MLIEGKVAAIVNERELAINRGADVGVKEGMIFKVVEPELDVTDPDTGRPWAQSVERRFESGSLRSKKSFA